MWNYSNNLSPVTILFKTSGFIYMSDLFVPPAAQISRGLLLKIQFVPRIKPLRTGRSGDRIPVGARFSAPVRTVLGSRPRLLYNGYRVFPGGKAAGAWR